MQTNFKDRQASLITEAIETIQEQVKLKGSPSLLDMETMAITYPESGLYFNHFNEIFEIDGVQVLSEDGDNISIHDLESDIIMQLADYCLNYKPQS